MKKKSSKKSKARELAFYVLFSSHTGKLEVDESLETFLKSDEAEGLKNEIIKKVRTWNKNRVEIDKLIKSHLKKGGLEDLSNVALSVLRLGFCEMEYLEDIPPGVAINEAVELAKKFGDGPTGRFVNGVMDARLKAKVTDT